MSRRPKFCPQRQDLNPALVRLLEQRSLEQERQCILVSLTLAFTEQKPFVPSPTSLWNTGALFSLWTWVTVTHLVSSLVASGTVLCAKEQCYWPRPFLLDASSPEQTQLGLGLVMNSSVLRACWLEESWAEGGRPWVELSASWNGLLTHQHLSVPWVKAHSCQGKGPLPTTTDAGGPARSPLPSASRPPS